MIEHIEHEETDEFLTYEMDRLVSYHEQHDELPEYHKVANILPDVKYRQPVFSDTLILEPGDNEMVPYRELRFSIRHDERDFTIVLRHLLLGHDDMLEGTILIVVGLLLVITLFVLLAIRNITSSIWRPFYETLDTLMQYQIMQPVPKLGSTKIEEFSKLNHVIQSLLNKISRDYLTKKEFNENISHELQTHLAIIRLNTERLLNAWDQEPGILEEVQQIYKSVNNLSQILSTLSLLSKIENGEFHNNSDVNLRVALEQSLTSFEERIGLKELSLDVDLSDCVLNIDSGLAEILISNLLKNAIVHNISKGFIRIRLTTDLLSIENSGFPIDVDAQKMIERFSKGPTGNSGIGLSIVEQICLLYNYSMSYTVVDQSIHHICVKFH